MSVPSRVKRYIKQYLENNAGNDSANLQSVNAESVGIGGVQTTEPGDGVSEVNEKLLNNDVVHILYDVDVGTTAIEIPSDTVAVNWATLKQADGTDDSGAHVIENADFSRSGSDTDIEFVNHGEVDGNQPNQTDGSHAVIFLGVTRLRLAGLHVIDPVDWGVRVDTCDKVRVKDYEIEVNNIGSHQDGLHFINTSNVEVEGVTGSSDDDLLAIGADGALPNGPVTVGNYSVSGVQGDSQGSGILKIHKANVGDGRSVTFENIAVSGLEGHDAGSGGVHLTPADADTTYDGVRIDGIIRNTTSFGLDDADATYRDCSIDLTIIDPGDVGANMSSATAIDNCDFDITVRNPPDSRDAMHFTNGDNSTVTLRSERSTSGTAKQHLFVDSSVNCDFDVAIDGGGERGIHLRDSVTDCVVEGSVKNVSTHVLESGSTPDNNRIEIHGDESTISRSLSGATTTVNGAGTESANAETPQNDWPAGTVVDFTDTGDGSGTGVYKLISGSWVQLA